MKNTLTKLLFLAGVLLSSSTFAQRIITPGGGSPNYKAPVADIGALPASGNNVNDIRTTLDTHNLFIWDGSAWLDKTGPGSVNWGSIGGTLSNQTDLQNALNLKFDTANFGSSFDSNLALKSTTNLTEGANLYFTDARARAAAVENAINSGTTDKAPSEDAVYNALATKVAYSDLSTAELYVDPVNGSDTATTGRGSVEKPYLTIQAAFNSVSNATTLNQWATGRITINLMPGDYSEAAPQLFYKRRSVSIVGHGAKVMNDINFVYDPTNQYTGFTYTQAGLPSPYTGGFASPTISFACHSNANGMESGFTTGCLMLMGRVTFSFPNYTTQSSPNYGSSYMTMNGVEARGGVQFNDAGANANSSATLELLNSVVSGNNVGLTRAGGGASTFGLKGADSRIASVIGPRAIIVKLDSMRLNTFDRTTSTNGTTGVYTTDGAIQFTNAATTSGITNCTFTGSTAKIGNQTGTSNSVAKMDKTSFNNFRGVATIDVGGGVTYNIMDQDKVTRVVATNGGSTTINQSTDHLLLDPAATIASYSVTMPASPIDQQEFLISAGGNGDITSFTLSPNAGQSFATGAAISTLVANSSVRYKYNSATSKWVKTQTETLTTLPPSGPASGDLTGSYPSPTLAAVGTAGTYTKVTTDSKGRVTSGTSLNSSDVTTALGFTPEDIANKGVANGYAPLDGSGKVSTSYLPASVLGAVNYQGTWDASANSPALSSGVGSKGFYYVVNTAGSTSIDGISSWGLNDWIVFNGTAWEKVDNNNAVTSVFGRTGTVTAQNGDYTTTQVTEGTNLYYTQARFDTAFAAKSTTDLAEGTNLYYTDARFDTRFGLKSTTDLAEGTNLYYTDARFDTRFGLKTTDDLTEGTTNKYYSSTLFDSDLATKTTTDLAEGINLYFTEARVRSSLLTGFVASAGTVAATDTVLEGFQKLAGNDAADKAVLSISSNTTGTDGTHYYFADTTSAAFDFTLPSAAAGLEQCVKVKAGANALTVIGTIDGQTNDTLNLYEYRCYLSDGAAWYVEN